MQNRHTPGDITINLPSPQPKQEEFLLASERYVGYGGARGGGKTWVLRLKAHLLCLFYPGIRILIIRRTLPELEENHIFPLRELSREVASYNETKKTLRYVNGSVILFGYATTRADLMRYQGQQYDVIMIDEATQFLEYVFTELKACVRGVNNFPKHMFFTCNPGGVGHAWFKRLFIDRRFNERENPNDYKFIQAKVHDNTALISADPDYVRELESLPDGLREMWLDGRWDVNAGSFFSEFDREVNVIDSIEEKDYWRYYVAIDYGLDALAAVLVAIDELGNEYALKELIQSDLIVSDAAAALLDFAREYNIYEWYAPPDLYSRQKDSGKSIIELFHEHGIDFVRADNDRVAGWMNVKEHLKPETLPGSDKRRSRLLILASCKCLIEYLPMLQISSRNPNDCDTEPHEITHICDALRYFCIMHNVPPKASRVKNELDEYKARIFSKGRSSRSKRW